MPDPKGDKLVVHLGASQVMIYHGAINAEPGRNVSM
jgi:hypothetical protein